MVGNGINVVVPRDGDEAVYGGCGGASELSADSPDAPLTTEEDRDMEAWLATDKLFDVDKDGGGGDVGLLCAAPGTTFGSNTAVGMDRVALKVGGVCGALVAASKLGGGERALTELGTSGDVPGFKDWNRSLTSGLVGLDMPGKLKLVSVKRRERCGGVERGAS